MHSLLPDDIDELKRLLAEQEALNRALLEKLNEREREIDHLQAQLDKLRRMNFGSRSEKVSRRIAQMEADLKQLQKESDILTGRVDDPAVQRPLRQTRTRKPFPESLPRDEKRLLPAASCCPECGGALSYLGEDAAEQLELMRSAFRVIRTVREKHACTQCDAIVQAAAPSRPIERGIAGPGLLARVLTSKYAEHTPLYRQSEIYARQGVELSRSLLSGWVDACCRLLSPLEGALQDYVLTDGKLHADDTPVPVLENNTLLKLDEGSNTASGLGIEILDANMRPVKLNDLHAGMQWIPLVPEQNNILPYSARLKSTQKSVNPGLVRASATFTLEFQ